MTRFLYNLSRLALLVLTLAFLSFFLITLDGMDSIQPVVDYATKYLPALLIPVLIAMAVLLLLRWMGKDKDEEVGFTDFFAAVLAIVFQVATIIVWRAQGNDIAGSLASNIPDVKILTEHAGTMGVLGVTALQFLAFVFYWIADPDPRTSSDNDHDHD